MMTYSNLTALADCIECAELRGRSLKDIFTNAERRILTTALHSPYSGAPGEAVVWSIRIRQGHATYNIYTERLPYEPIEDCNIVVLGEPIPLYANPTTLPRDAERETIERCAEIADAWVADCGNFPTQILNARDYAVGAVKDVADAIRALPSIPPREGVIQSTTEQADASRDHPVREAIEQSEIERLRDALQIIADWQNTRIGDEHEHSLRDIIRSITDCADRALSPSPTSVMPDEGKQK